jgi:hypothetical protein
MSLDFEERLTSIASSADMVGIKVRPEAIAIGIKALVETDKKYGPLSPTPLSFHNAYHSLDMTERVIRLTNLLYRFIPLKYVPHVFELGVTGGTSHDWERRLSGTGANEKASSAHAIEEIESRGGPLNYKRFKERLDLGIVATTVEREENGELVQSQLQKGEADPFKFFMCFADIDGIAMDGPVRMLNDATNLYLEELPDHQLPSAKGLLKTLGDQEIFIRQRLGDRRIKADIAYHFPDSIEAVYQVMHEAFHENIESSSRLAKRIGQSPELEAPLTAAMKGTDVFQLGHVVCDVIREHVGNELLPPVPS